MKPLQDLRRLCVHTVTNKPWPLEQCARKYARAGIGGISVWRDAAQGHKDGIRAGGRLCRDGGLEIVSYVRGGFFAARDAEDGRRAVDDNRRVIDEAAELGAPLVVLVCGAVPGQALEESRRQIAAGLAAVEPHARAAGVRLGIEPLHPMYADSRSAVVTLKQANDLAEQLDSPWIGVTVDVFHVWWNEALEGEIARCGAAGKLFSYHICDWKDRAEDMLNDRGLMGEGCIDLRRIRGWAEAAGFRGPHEVEIFSNRYWAMDQDAYLRMIVDAYRSHA